MNPTTAPAPTALGTMSLQTYLQVLRRQWKVIIGIAVLTAALGAVPALLASPKYGSEVQVRISSLDDQGVYNPDGRGTRLATDQFYTLVNEVEIIRSPALRQAVEARLEPDVPEFDDPEVTQIGLTDVVKISIKAPEATIAADVAKTYAEVYVEDRQQRSVAALERKAAELRDQSAAAKAELEDITNRLLIGDIPLAEATSIQARQSTLIAQVQDYDSRADQLDVEAALRGSGTEVIAPAELDLDPIKRSPLIMGLLGLVLGLLLGTAIAVVVDTVQDRLGSRDDLAAVRPDLPILAAIPHSGGSRDGELGHSAQEAYRYLRTSLRVFGLNTRLRSLVVTSAVGEEGKTTTAMNLARSMAETGERVVLVDCDLRRPTLHDRFDLSNDAGVSSVVIGDAALDEAIHFVTDNLAVIPAGPAVPDPTEVLSSEQFAVLLESLVEQADFVIVDSPPVLPVADALVVAQRVDGALVVSRVGLVRRRAVRDLLSRLEEAEVRLAGFVANDVNEALGYQYYSYSSDEDGKGKRGKRKGGSSRSGRSARRAPVARHAASDRRSGSRAEREAPGRPSGTDDLADAGIEAPV